MDFDRAEVKLRHQLDVQTRQIDRVLNHHRVPATVSGGEVRPKVVSFDLQTQIAHGLERIRGLKDDLMTALGVGDVVVSQDEGQWRLRVARPDDPPVPLLRLMNVTPGIPQRTAVIGMADGGQPVLLRFAANKVTNVLIAGETGAGKTSLLRSIALSLAAANRQSALQLLVMDGRSDEESTRRTALLPLGYLPHMLTDPALGSEACATLLHFLAEEMTYRRRDRVQSPRIIVLIDHVLSLMDSGPQVKDDLLRLLQHGAQAGIHLVMATDTPDSPLLDSTVKACLSMRIIGRIADPTVARRLAGTRLDQAPLLYGEGDFLAVNGENVTYFQAAYAGDYDMHLKLTEMLRGDRPRLLARPYSSRPRVAGEPQPQTPRTFAMRDGAVDLDPDEAHIIDGD